MKNFFYLLILSISFQACKTDTKSNTKLLDKSKTQMIDSLANRYLELDRFSGVILVSKADTIIYKNSFGLADYENNVAFSGETSFKIGKISELITTNMVNELAKKNKIKLSDKITQYLPEIDAGFTIEDLLNHQTNLPTHDVIQSQNPDLPYSTIAYTNFANRNSEASEYSELNYNILGLLVEKVSGISFEENLANYAAQQELENTWFQKPENKLAAGYLHYNYRGKGLELQKSPNYNDSLAFSGNGIKSTANDLLKIINLNPSHSEDFFGYTPDDGFSYSLINDPKTQTAIVILSNRRHPVAREISNSISAILQNEEYRMPLLRKPFAIDKNQLSEFTGTYSLNENMNFKVLTENDSLFVMMGSQKIHLIPQSANQFYMPDNDAAQRFVKDSNDSVIAIELLDGFLDGEIVKRVVE